MKLNEPLKKCNFCDEIREDTLETPPDMVSGEPQPAPALDNAWCELKLYLVVGYDVTLDYCGPVHMDLDRAGKPRPDGDTTRPHPNTKPKRSRYAPPPGPAPGPPPNPRETP
jgi:hypothetical protein